jgi:hypothetical protein
VRIDPGDFARYYNAAQLVTAPVLAIAANSPFFAGRILWDETRIALFKQAVDHRKRPFEGFHPPARVSLGEAWIEESATELFAREIAQHQPLLPELAAEDPLESLRSGKTPGLHELRLHNSTIWLWNRPVYDPAGGGHLRLELRSLPSGPTIVDMLANSAFAIGLIHHFAAETSWRGFDFAAAHNNFYRAAQEGIDAQLAWPGRGTVGVLDLLEELLPLAQSGLALAGVDAAEADAYLEPIAGRVAGRITGARWQREALTALSEGLDRQAAMSEIVRIYAEHSASEEPVHAWPRMR